VELHDGPQPRVLGVFAYLYWLYRNRDRFAAARVRHRPRVRHAGPDDQRASDLEP